MKFPQNSSYLSFGFLLVSFAVSSAFGNTTVRFDDANRGPSSVLQISGVVITSGYPSDPLPSLPSTVAGVGLGSATIAPIATLDRVQGSTAPFAREALNLSVASIGAKLISAVVTPYFSIVGSTDSIFIPFDISIVPNDGPEYYRTPTNAAPMTLVIGALDLFGSNNVSLGLEADFGNPYVVQYLQDHPGAVAQFGFTINSVTFAPVADNDNPTIVLLGLTGLALLICEKRFARRKAFC